MSLYRIKPWLAAMAVVCLFAGPTIAQDQVPDSTLASGQLFDPNAQGTFGGGPAQNQGYFFTWDALYWTISRPPVTSIGNPGLTRTVFITPDIQTVQSNTIDTGMLKSDWTWGQRFEFGDIVGHHGWIFNYEYTRIQSQIIEGRGLVMTIDDREFGPLGIRHLDGPVPTVDVGGDPTYGPPEVFGPLPLQFDTFRVENFTDWKSVEWMYMFRTHPIGFERSWFSEWCFGVRYMEFEDRFNVFGGGDRFRFDLDGVTPIGAASILSESQWNTDAMNRIVGPQAAVRFWTQRGRWTFSTFTKFFAGFNQQTVRQDGTLGSRLGEPYPVSLTGVSNYGTQPFVPSVASPTNFNHSFTANEFSPGIELRIEGKVDVTRGFSLKAGYDMLWMDGIARASNMIDYVWSETQTFGIRGDNNRNSVFMNGFHFGLEFNR